MTEAIDARLSRLADHKCVYAAPDTIAIVYSAGIAVVTTFLLMDTITLAVTIVGCAAFAVITIFRDVSCTP